MQPINSLCKFHSFSPEPSPISHCLPSAAEQMPFSLLDCIEPRARCSGILLRWRPPPPPLWGGRDFKKKKKKCVTKKKRKKKKNIYHLAGRIFAPSLCLIETSFGIRSTSSQLRIRELPLRLFVSAMVLWLYIGSGFLQKKKKKRGGGGSCEKMNCPSTHATTTTPPLGWLRLRLLLHRCRAHLADQDVLSVLSALGRFFA